MLLQGKNKNETKLNKRQEDSTQQRNGDRSHDHQTHCTGMSPTP